MPDRVFFHSNPGAPISIQVEGIDGVAQIIPNYRKQALRAMREATNKSLLVIQYFVVAELGKYEDTGNAAKSVVIKKPANNAFLTVTGDVHTEGPAEKYMDTIEFGRKTGATPPPMGELEGWIARHPGFRGTPFALARAIGRRGLQPRHPWETAFDKAQEPVDRIINKAVDDLVERITTTGRA